MAQNRPVIVLSTPLPDRTAKLRMHGISISGQYVRVRAHKLAADNTPLGILDAHAAHADALPVLEGGGKLDAKFQSLVQAVFRLTGTIGAPVEAAAPPAPARKVTP